MSVEHCYASIADGMKRVDSIIRARLYSDVVLIQQVAEYIVGNGGKRLRPALVLLSASAFGYGLSGECAHYELAAAVEFIHTATLLHDDVVDESALRRGHSTVNALFGNAASVLVGDFLYSRAFQMMLLANDMSVMRVLADATNTIAEGEVLQLLNCGNADVTVDAYLQVIRYKTAKLFEASARLGAILGQAQPEHEEAMARFGMHLGTAFQLIDDVLDYEGDEAETGKCLGDDLAEGKATLPLIYAMQTGSPEQAKLVRQAIEQNRRDDFADVLQVIRATGALVYARSQAEKEIQSALAAIADIPASDHLEALIQLAQFSTGRQS